MADEQTGGHGTISLGMGARFPHEIRAASESGTENAARPFLIAPSANNRPVSRSAYTIPESFLNSGPQP